MAKAKRYEEGGITEGANANIGDDTRARAMAWLKKQQEGGAEEEPAASPAPVRKAAPVAKPAVKPAAKVTDTGDETARLAARRPAPKKPAYETPYDRMNRMNREAASSGPSGQDRILRNVRPGAVNPKTLLPAAEMKKGGSVSKASSRADGIAMRGKTRGRVL